MKFARVLVVFLVLMASCVPSDDIDLVVISQSAEQGDLIAQLKLGDAYFFGKGVLKDKEDAVKWYRKAAEQGVAVAQYNVGVAYNSGKGAPKDPVEAHAWLNLAGASGVKTAGKLRDEIERSMSREQIAQATKRAKQLLAAIKKPV